METTGRNLVLCLDGTANTFGAENTNVVRVAQVIAHTGRQLLYYDPGVGTLPDPGLLTRTGQAISKMIDLAFATSLAENVGQAYGWLMQTWRPEDRIYLFGFSRGAYTARLVAAMLHYIGLLPPDAQNLIPYAIQIQRGVGKNATLKVGDQFRAMFAQPTAQGGRIPIHFLGIWDTVLSVGWVWNQAKYRFTTTNPSVATVRHAISIDERRAFYRQNRVQQASAAQDLEQRWFPGVHADIGGGYDDASKLWQPSFDWVLDEAAKTGLEIDANARALYVPATPRAWAEKRHNEVVKPKWWIPEIFPTRHWNGKRYTPHLNLFNSRTVKDGELLDRSALLRIKYEIDGYAPKNLSKEFRERVNAMADADIPEAMRYDAPGPSPRPATPPAPHPDIG